jgi:taurine dioxygenase
VEVEPLAGALGAEVRGADLRRLDEAGWRELHAAFLRYAVLAIRDQELEPADIMQVGARFGEPCFYPFVTGIDGFPYIFEVVKEEGETTNFGGNWHSDTTYLEQPPLGTLLYAVETPAQGGDTLFASTAAAYDALSPGMRALLDPLIGVNSAALKHGGGRHQMHKTINSMKLHDIEAAGRYEAEHPVVRTHPETGRKALYVSRSHTVRFRDMSEEESRPLVEFLQAHQTRPEFTCRVRWTPGTLTVWDNRCTQHNAVNDYRGHRRLMHRITLAGDVPTGADPA